MVLTKSNGLQIAFAKDIDIYRAADQYIYLIIVASISLLRCQDEKSNTPTRNTARWYYKLMPWLPDKRCAEYVDNRVSLFSV